MVSKKHITKTFALMAVVAFFLAGCGGAPGSSTGGSSVATIKFQSATPSELALAGQGGDENSVVVFKVADQDDRPLRGVGVSFEVSETVGGVMLSTYSATSNAAGEVSTVVRAGSTAIAVFVTATINGTTTRAFSDEISISTSSFIGSSFPLTVIVGEGVSFVDDFPSGYNKNFYESSASGSVVIESAGQLAGISVEMQMIVRDQFGHKVRDGSRVTMVSPTTGLFEPSTCVVEGGICQTTWTSSESGLVGESIVVIAYASGAESFTDTNGNNIFDPGELYDDYPEAFADENFNGIFDQGEFFVDANSNGVYDPFGNGVWDGPCLTGVCEGESSTIIWDTLVFTLAACPTPDCSDSGQ